MSLRRRRTGYATRTELVSAVSALNERITTLEASEQGQIDAITASLSTVKDDLGTAQVKLQSEIDSIVAGNPPNLDALTAVAASLDPLVQTIGGLTPTPPATPAPTA